MANLILLVKMNVKLYLIVAIFSLHFGGKMALTL